MVDFPSVQLKWITKHIIDKHTQLGAGKISRMYRKGSDVYSEHRLGQCLGWQDWTIIVEILDVSHLVWVHFEPIHLYAFSNKNLFLVCTLFVHSEIICSYQEEFLICAIHRKIHLENWFHYTSLQTVTIILTFGVFIIHDNVYICSPQVVRSLCRQGERWENTTASHKVVVVCIMLLHV